MENVKFNLEISNLKDGIIMKSAAIMSLRADIIRANYRIEDALERRYNLFMFAKISYLRKTIARKEVMIIELQKSLAITKDYLKNALEM